MLLWHRLQKPIFLHSNLFIAIFLPVVLGFSLGRPLPLAAQPQNPSQAPTHKPLDQENKENNASQTNSQNSYQAIGKKWIEQIHKQQNQNTKNSATPSLNTQEERINPKKDNNSNETTTPKQNSEDIINPNTVPNTDTIPEVAEQDTPSFFTSILRFLFFILLLILGLYITLRLFRKRLHTHLLPNNHNELVQVILSIPLVQGKFLQIVDVAGQLLILGTSEAGIQLLSKVDDGITADRIRLWKSQEEPTLSKKNSKNNFLVNLITLLKESDLRFWGHTREAKKQNQHNFSRLLNQYVNIPEKASSKEESSRETKSQKSKQARELKQLLAQQKNRLEQLNKKKQ